MAPEFGRVVRTMTAPILCAEIGDAAIQFTDTAFLGRIGSAELAAIGFVDSLIEVAVVPAIGLIGAMQIAVARRTGQQREDEVAATFDRTIRLVLPTVIGIGLFLRLGTEAYADRIIDSAAVAAAMADFFRYGVFGVVFFALNFAYSSLYVGIGRTRILVAATALVFCVNLAVTYLLVFGRAGAPRLGMEGAGIGFAVAEASTLVFFAHRARRQIGVGGWTLIRPRVIGGVSAARLLRLGWPISGHFLIETLRWVGFLLIVARIGEDALAASSMVFACYGLLIIPAVAFSEAAFSLVSNLIGRGRAGSMSALLHTLVTSAYAITLPLALFGALWPGAALSLFTGDQATIAAASAPLRIVSLVMLVMVPAEMWSAAVFGTADTAIGSLIEFIASGIMIGAAYLAEAVLGLGLTYVWATLGLAAVFTLAASYGRIHAGAWRRHRL
ncbi:MATE family efflux transporter [Streptomyces sp. NK08204]|uniref:MATE family efflux transporter n=1 Tax=Streptomyces sp. NK08204 TaxID=2873260 RepID=UPI001CEC912F|nr:MATE family efflux transporter [Streptomyces sp. NK08204]